MNEIAKLVNKFSGELEVGMVGDNVEMTKMYLAGLIAEARDAGSSLAFEVDDDEDNSEEVGSIGTVYIDLKPRVDGFIDALKKLNED